MKTGKIIEGQIIEKKDEHIIIKGKNGYDRILEQDVVYIEKDKDPIDDLVIDIFQYEDIPPEKVTLIVKMLKINGTLDSMKANLDQVIANAPPEREAELKELFRIEPIVERLVPFYDKYFLVSDLEEIIAFYSSPTGKKLMEVTPHLIKEAIQVNAEYFKQRMNK